MKIICPKASDCQRLCGGKKEHTGLDTHPFYNDCPACVPIGSKPCSAYLHLDKMVSCEIPSTDNCAKCTFSYKCDLPVKCVPVDSKSESEAQIIEEIESILDEYCVGGKYDPRKNNNYKLSKIIHTSLKAQGWKSREEIRKSEFIWQQQIEAKP